MIILHLVLPAGLRAMENCILIRSGQAETMATHPTLLPSWNTHHERIIRHIAVDDSSGSDEGIAPNGDATDNGGIGANGGTPFNQSFLIFVTTVNLTAGIDDIGEDAGGTQETVVFDDDAGVDGDIVLDLDVVTEDDTRGDDHILAEAAVFANLCAGHDVGEMPDLRAPANLGAFIDIAGRVDKEVGHFRACLLSRGGGGHRRG